MKKCLANYETHAKYYGFIAVWKERQKCSFSYKIQTQWPIIGIPSENNCSLESICYFIQLITDIKVIFVNKPVTREGSSGEEEDFIPLPKSLVVLTHSKHNDGKGTGISFGMTEIRAEILSSFDLAVKARESYSVLTSLISLPS